MAVSNIGKRPLWRFRGSVQHVHRAVVHDLDLLVRTEELATVGEASSCTEPSHSLGIRIRIEDEVIFVANPLIADEIGVYRNEIVPVFLDEMPPRSGVRGKLRQTRLLLTADSLNFFKHMNLPAFSFKHTHDLSQKASGD